MTDTTDIAALRSKAANVIGLLTAESLTGSFALDSLADVFDDMFRLLEAERQWADDEKALNKHLGLAIRKSEGVNANLRRRAEKAEEEIAALKAKLANPVVLPAGYAARAGHPFHEGERNVMIPNKHGDWLSRFEVEHAIHVAGFRFTVKGE